MHFLGRKKVNRLLIVLGLFAVPGSLAAWVLLGDLFHPRLSYPTGEHPLDVALADIDEDGNLDILTASREGRSISIFLGNGRGGFQEYAPIRSERGFTSLTLGNLNQDRHLDIAASMCQEGCTENGIGIFYGAGDGSFTSGPWIPVAGVPYNIALADFNRDQRLDLAASDHPGNQLWVLLAGPEEGSFQSKTLEAGTHPIAILVRDLDLDGNPDLISSDHGSGASSVYMGNGTGEFSHRIVIPTDTLPYSIALANLDPDAIPDLVVAHSSSPGRISVYRGFGDGTFGFLDQFLVDDRLVFVDAADCNGDEKPDVIVTRSEKSYASVFLNRGDGTLNRSEIVVPAENRIYSLAVGRLNGDIYPDLVTVDYEKNTLSVALGKPLSPSASSGGGFAGAAEMAFATLEKGDRSGIPGERLEAIRTKEDWEIFWRDHTSNRESRAPRAEVDFSKEMVLCAVAGPLDGLGHELSIERVTVDGESLIAGFLETSPSEKVRRVGGLTTPYHFVKTVRFEGPVRFRKLERKG